MPETHRMHVRIYYEDTDFSGFVYHAAYLKFFERGRTEFLRDLGVYHAELAEQGLAFAVRSMEIDFEAAARIDDLLCVETAVVESSGARLMLSQSVTRGDRVLTQARVVVAAVRIGGGATRLPKALLERLRS
jgi:acyl-CoA thioester hydrolase